MNPLHRIAEQRLAEAAERGELSNLPLAGKPLDLEDLGRIPAELRAGYMLLKSAGVLPEEMQQQREVRRIEDLLAACTDDEELARELRVELRAQRLRFELLMERHRGGAAWGTYRSAIERRLSR